MLQAFFPRLRRRPPSLRLFSLGTLQLNDKVQWLDDKGLIDPLYYLRRHLHGDWGEISDDRRRSNLDALETGEGVIASKYAVTPRLILLVMTTADRTLTVIQLPEEKPLL